MRAETKDRREEQTIGISREKRKKDMPSRESPGLRVRESRKDISNPTTHTRKVPQNQSSRVSERTNQSGATRFMGYTESSSQTTWTLPCFSDNQVQGSDVHTKAQHNSEA